MAVDGVALASMQHHRDFDSREPIDIVDAFSLRQKPMDFEKFATQEEQIKYVESRHQITLHVIDYGSEGGDNARHDILLRQAVPIDDEGYTTRIEGDHNFAYNRVIAMYKILSMQKLLTVFGVTAYTAESVHEAALRVMTHSNRESVLADYAKKHGGKISSTDKQRVLGNFDRLYDGLFRSPYRYSVMNLKANRQELLQAVDALYSLNKNPASESSVLARVDELLQTMDQLTSLEKYFDNDLGVDHHDLGDNRRGHQDIMDGVHPTPS